MPAWPAAGGNIKVVRTWQRELHSFIKLVSDSLRKAGEIHLAKWKEAEIQRIYEGIKLPRRATAGSAGYDFYMPADMSIAPGETVKIPTGIRVEMQEEWVLKCYPRSGLGFKYRLQLNNTVGIIDSDYFGSDNEGHIFAKLTMIRRKAKQ